MNKINVIKSHSGQLKDKRAFTLVETLVAITILTLALTGPLTIISQALKSAYYSRDQIVAFYLAQEAVEYIRNIRDGNALNPSPTWIPSNWLDGIGDPACSGSPSACINPYDAATNNAFSLTRNAGGAYIFTACPGGTCSKLGLDTRTIGTPYGGSSAPSTSIFTRTIWLTTVPNDLNAMREVVVHVRVNWSQGTAPYSFTLEEHLTNWKISSGS